MAAPSTCFATLVDGKGYISGVVALAASLRAQNSRAPLIAALVVGSLETSDAAELEQHAIECRWVDPIQAPQACRKRTEWAATFSKLRIW